MKRNMFLAFVASAALLMVSAGSVAEARHWNRGYSRGHVHYGYNGFRGNYRTNYGHYRPMYHYHTPYRSWNGYGNTYYNPYYNQYYSPYRYGNGLYYGSNNAGIYFGF